MADRARARRRPRSADGEETSTTTKTITGKRRESPDRARGRRRPRSAGGEEIEHEGRGRLGNFPDIKKQNGVLCVLPTSCGR
jgi:hypothetical protein